MQSDLLGSIKQSNAPLYASLLATKRAFQRRFGFKVFPLVPHNAPKEAIKADRNAPELEYPFAYWKLQTVNIVKDEQNAKILRRRGVNLGNDSNTGYNVGYFFPAILNCAFVYETHQLEDALSFMERWLILMSTEALNVKVSLPLGEGAEFTCRIFVEDTSVAMPEVDIDDESAPQVFRYELPFNIRAVIGTHKNVPKFNNEGEIKIQLEVE